MNSPVSPNNQLIELKNGSEEALEKYRDKYRPEITMIIFRLSKNKKIARDVYAMVLIEVWKKRTRFDNELQLARYMRAVARDKYLALSKADGPKSETEILLGNPCSPVPPRRIWGGEADEINDRLWAAVYRLSPRRRQVVLLKVLEGMSYTLIVIILGIEEQTCRNTYAQAMNILRSDPRMG